jgi:hypothetical protein
MKTLIEFSSSDVATHKEMHDVSKPALSDIFVGIHTDPPDVIITITPSLLSEFDNALIVGVPGIMGGPRTLLMSLSYLLSQLSSDHSVTGPAFAGSGPDKDVFLDHFKNLNFDDEYVAENSQIPQSRRTRPGDIVTFRAMTEVTTITLADLEKKDFVVDIVAVF